MSIQIDQLTPDVTLLNHSAWGQATFVRICDVPLENGDQCLEVRRQDDGELVHAGTRYFSLLETPTEVQGEQAKVSDDKPKFSVGDIIVVTEAHGGLRVDGKCLRLSEVGKRRIYGAYLTDGGAYAAGQKLQMNTDKVERVG